MATINAKIGTLLDIKGARNEWMRIEKFQGKMCIFPAVLVIDGRTTYKPVAAKHGDTVKVGRKTYRINVPPHFELRNAELVENKDAR